MDDFLNIFDIDTPLVTNWQSYYTFCCVTIDFNISIFVTRVKLINYKILMFGQHFCNFYSTIITMTKPNHTSKLAEKCIYNVVPKIPFLFRYIWYIGRYNITFWQLKLRENELIFLIFLILIILW